MQRIACASNEQTTGPMQTNDRTTTWSASFFHVAIPDHCNPSECVTRIMRSFQEFEQLNRSMIRRVDRGFHKPPRIYNPEMLD